MAVFHSFYTMRWRDLRVPSASFQSDGEIYTKDLFVIYN